MSMYAFFLAAAVVLGCGMFFAEAKRAGLELKAAPVFMAFAVVIIAAFGRLYLHLTKYTINGMGFWGYTVFSLRPYEYAVCGAVLGLLLAGCLYSWFARINTWCMLDALAVPALFALALARFGEHFSDFGWGQILLNAAWQRFPFAVADIYGQWHFAVYLLEGVFALAVGVWVLKHKSERPGQRFLRALLWWAATQIICESLRAETIRWGFVRVQQLQCAVFMLAVLLINAQRKGGLKRCGKSVMVFMLGVGILVFVEYALDKLESIPVVVCYGLMVAALLLMGRTAEKQSGDFVDEK